MTFTPGIHDETFVSDCTPEEFMALATRPRPTTEFIYPPIPLRCFDWIAYHDPEGVSGYGETEEAALEDLRSQLED